MDDELEKLIEAVCCYPYIWQVNLMAKEMSGRKSRSR